MRVVAVLVISLSLFMIFFRSISAHGNPNSVHITTGGFVPTEINIKLNDTVTFENLDDTNHWPASDIHPTHGVYPEFDPKQALSPNESWEFTFTKAGRFQYHDHGNPNLVGVVIVEGTEITQKYERKNGGIIYTVKLFVSRIFYSFFPGKIDDFNMFTITQKQEDLEWFLDVFGAEAAMKKLLTDAKGGTKVDCHQQAHTLGRVAFGMYGAEVFQKGDSACHSGFYHGAMETFLFQEGTENLGEKIMNICENFKTSFSNFECLHGVGHGVMAYASYDLPRALEICQSLPDGYTQSSCYGGVFMENIVVGQNQGGGAGGQHKTTWLSTDPHFPCNSVEAEINIQEECYKMQTSRMLFLNGYNFQKVAVECTNAPNDMVSTCFISMGRDAAGHTLRNPDKIIPLCNYSPDSYKEYCFQGALNVIVEFWGEKLAGQADGFCKKLPTAYHRDLCDNQLAGRKIDVFRNKEVN